MRVLTRTGPSNVSASSSICFVGGLAPGRRAVGSIARRGACVEES